MAEASAETPSKTYRSISIAPCLNGFICQIGCQQAVFTSAEDLSAAVKEYYSATDPIAKEKEWLAKSMVRGAETIAPQAGLIQGYAPEPVA